METKPQNTADATAPQAAANEAQSPPLINLCRAWMRASAADRALFHVAIGAKITQREGADV